MAWETLSSTNTITLLCRQISVGPTTYETNRRPETSTSRRWAVVIWAATSAAATRWRNGSRRRFNRLRLCVCVCVPLCVFCVWSVLPISRAHQVSALRHPIRLQLTHKRAGRSIWWRPYLVIGWRLLCVPIGVGNADREKLIVNYETKKTKALDLSLVSRQTPLEI